VATPRPEAGTELEREVQALLRGMRESDARPIAVAAPPRDVEPEPETIPPLALDSEPPCEGAQLQAPFRPMPDVLGAFSRRVLPAAPQPEEDPRAQAAALFDGAWASLCEGRPLDALVAIERALALDPTNRTYATDLRRLRAKLGMPSKRKDPS
jgi:hypothetical protein